MKKVFSILFLSLAILFIYPLGAQASYAPGCTANNNTTDPAAWDSVNNKPIGLVPCGISMSTSNVYGFYLACKVRNASYYENISYKTTLGTDRQDAQNKADQMAAIYPCTSSQTRSVVNLIDLGPQLACPCQLEHFFMMILRIFNFVIWVLAIPIATLLIFAGGVLLLISAGNPGLADRGKSLIKGAIIALLLIFLSWLIIDVVLKIILGYPLQWWKI